MSIVFKCHSCDRRISVAESKAGVKGTCPDCKAVLTVPRPAAKKAKSAGPVPAPPARDAKAMARQAPPATAVKQESTSPKQTPKTKAPPAKPAAAAPAPVPATRPEVQQRILQSFSGQIERVMVSPMYKLGVAAAAAFMVSLPVIYLAIIGAVAWLIYWHATANVGMLAYGTGRGKIVVFLLYAAPIVVGSIVVLFMIKPIFAPPAREGRERSINDTGEPLLVAFVHRICDIVGAPRPVRINVDYSVNASASFRRGFLSFFGSDLVLTIGVPLAAGLTLRQFAGVLAHEMGHFSQGTGMRVSYVTRSVNHWLTRVVYQRDQWDVMLEEASENLDLRLAWVLWLARMGVFLSRGILWILMMLGHFVSGFLLRQMEFDADRYEARVAGSDTFAKTSDRLALLSVAEQISLHELAAMYHRSRFVDNWSGLVLTNLQELNPELKAEVLKHHREGETGWFSTHPSDKDRIASALQEEAPGVFRLDGKSAVLFEHFETLQKNVTWDMHCAYYGSKVTLGQMEPLAEIRATAAGYDNSHRPPVDDTPIPFD